MMAASFNLVAFVAVSAENERLAVKVTMHPVDCVCLYWKQIKHHPYRHQQSAEALIRRHTEGLHTQGWGACQ